MSVYFVIADTTGLITNVCFSPTDNTADWPRPAGHSVTLLPDRLGAPADHYRVVDGAVVERDTMTPTVWTVTITADGTAECVISDLPTPCTVTITGAVTAGPVEVTGGSLTLTTTQPGAITISVRADPTHKPWETTVHAA